MHDFGRMKVEHQMVAMPEMTVLINNRRPAKESDFADHDETRATMTVFIFICSSTFLIDQNPGEKM